MGFIKYTLIFFIISFLLVGVLYLDNYILTITAGILLGILNVVYLWYIFYKITVSKYCWVILSPFILVGFLNGIIPGIIMVAFIYFFREMTLVGKKELERNGIYNGFDLIKYFYKEIFGDK